ncbi:endonuclease MutS2 [Treponema phagedenis]|uniref:endonuclease MutS2 n=1 Tax=Treponema phagedenis TaxID=162 RepID=UPI0001F63CBC|nr:endonuclease MutS2 [Treponema phagedenis]EFW37642.1 MutS2 family protein [Treponema phagedenis F0421]TYT79575.1 endonuclease MutS2 [Treponema phagedenis]
MTEHTLEVLEFNKICAAIAAYCVTEEGRAACLQKKPLTDKEKITAEKKLGSDFLSLLQTGAEPSVKKRPPLIEFLQSLGKEGSALSIEGIYSIGISAKHCNELHAWADAFEKANANKTPQQDVLQFIRTFPNLLEVYKAVFSFIDEDGDLKDIPELRSIKNKIAAIESDIEKTMRSYFTDEHTRDLLQTNIPVLRNGRQVLSVRSNFKGRIKGIIHEYSQSGQSFYLEPEEIVFKNNELLSAHAEYDRELQRLLKELTAKIAAYAPALEELSEKLIALDCVSASAKWAKNFHCVFAAQPQKDTAAFFLHQARHPLLGKTAVPIDLKLVANDRLLIITGPNTGGKTVSLKTAALFALMNQTGWPVPAGAQTCLPYFNFIACDIGDEQSLEQSLSTFSAHMQNIAEILRSADKESLIILDELASGTDPLEGGAIAMAVLDELAKRDALVFVTTHHGSLKNYGYTKQNCVNASVEFNESTLSPTYKIIMGVPGESHAIDIAERNGMPQHIIAQARAYIQDNRADVSALIQSLVQKHADLNKFEEEKQIEQQALRSDRRRIDLKELQLKQKELELRKQGYKRLDNLFSDKRRELENLIREIKEGELTSEKTKKVKQWFDNFESELAEEKTGMREENAELTALIKKRSDKNKHQTPQTPFSEGMTVYVSSFRRKGTLIRKEKKDTWLVSFDTVKMVVFENDLQPLESEQQKKQPVQIITEISSDKRPQFELRLLGLRIEAAEKALQDQLDLSAMHGIKEFAVIHGKGSGILQTMVHEKLKQTAFVQNFYFARPEDGGTGKTIVHLE